MASRRPAGARLHTWARRAAVAGAAVLLATAAAACDTDDGRALDPPAPGATAPPLAGDGGGDIAVTPTTIDNGVRLTSVAFADGQPLPARYAACGGENISPPLAWTGIPDNVVELALVVNDPQGADGAGFLHWVVSGLPPALVSIGEGSLPDEAVESSNGTSEYGWFGPCPPAGETHTYVFTLYAFAQATGIEPGTSGNDALDVIARTPGYAATLTATYTGVA